MADGKLGLKEVKFIYKASDDYKLDAETMDMCQRNGLLPYIELLDRMIRGIYHNVRDIKHRILVLPSSSKNERLRFEIHLSGKPAQILADERKFHEIFFEQIPEEKQDFFSVTYRVE